MEKKTKYKRIVILATLVGIFVFTVFIRTFNLLSLPVFADEAIYLRWAQVMKSEPTLRFLPLSDGKQPFFMWSVIPFLKIIDDPLVATRTVSVFAGLASLLGIFLIGVRLFGWFAGLMTALFYATSPLFVFFDRIGLVDSMLTAFGIWVLFLGILAAQTLRLDLAFLTGFVLGGAWLTKSPAIFFFLLLPTTILMLPFSRKGERLRNVLKFAFLVVVSWLIGFLIYNILRLGPNFHMIAQRNKDYVFTTQEVLSHPLDPFIPHIQEVGKWLFALLPWTIFLTALLGLFAVLKSSLRTGLLISSWAVLPILVVSEYAKVFTVRYILPFSYPFLLLAVFGVIFLSKKLKIHTLVLVLLVLIPALIIDYKFVTSPESAPLPRVMRSGYLEEWTAGTGIREIAQYLKQQLDKNDGSIVVGTEGFFGTLPDGLQVYFDKNPNITIIGVGISIEKIPSQLIEARNAGDRVYLVVNESRFKIKNLEAVGLKLVQAYPKAVRPDGTQDKLLLMELE